MYSFLFTLIALLAPLAAPFHKKLGLMVRGHRDTWRTLQRRVEKGRRYVWFHAASLGEFEQGRPLMERLRREEPDVKILLTFFSPSGYEVRKNYEGADIVCYLPFDTPAAARRFLSLVQPEAAYFIKYEFWHNYIRQLYRRGIPVYSVSSIFRPGQVFFRPLAGSYKRVLKKITHFYVQNEQSRELLAGIGIRCVSVVGDTRFDRVIDIRRAAKPLPLVEAFAGEAKSAKVLVCGSTWPACEDIIIPYFNAHPELKLVLAPHVVSERHLAEIEAKLQRPALRYSLAEMQSVKEAHCLIIDCYGLLSSIYRYATVAYVGGGFGVGIHNVPEAAVYGVPVLIGPNNKKFREARALLRAGGCREVVDAESFGRTLTAFLTQPALLRTAAQASADYICENAGATDEIFRATRGGKKRPHAGKDAPHAGNKTAPAGKNMPHAADAGAPNGNATPPTL